MLKPGMKYIAMVIEVIMLLGVIGAGVSIYNQTKPVSAYTAEKARVQAEMQELAEYSPYDGHTVSGSSLITAMRRYALKQSFYIYVKQSASNMFIANPTNGSTTTLDFNFTTGQLRTTTTSSANITLSQMLTEGSTYYISPQDSYAATVVRDSNRRVTGIYFMKK